MRLNRGYAEEVHRKERVKACGLRRSKIMVYQSRCCDRRCHDGGGCVVLRTWSPASEGRRNQDTRCERESRWPVLIAIADSTPNEQFD